MLDFTHGMNAYGFDLATVLDLDDKREGFPLAFILSNRQDSKALSLAFVAIKEYVSISPKVLMTDEAESFYNALRTDFGILGKKNCAHGMWTEVGGEIYQDKLRRQKSKLKHTRLFEAHW
ncbi:hypothetical protein NPIL_101991 [Nephila pilipes]|uniref:MULE transposase domain-containing protein n=1 Tax=Nephila pilipes TaxID=299642 RepID=A0A8X6TIQ5_NEPPI|nr:hypothetical protein NPIL_101991 [Nephila pilipes]